MAAMLDFKMAATYFETLYVPIGFLDPINVGIGV